MPIYCLQGVPAGEGRNGERSYADDAGATSNTKAECNRLGSNTRRTSHRREDPMGPQTSKCQRCLGGVVVWQNGVDSFCWTAHNYVCVNSIGHHYAMTSRLCCCMKLCVDVNMHLEDKTPCSVLQYGSSCMPPPFTFIKTRSAHSSKCFFHLICEHLPLRRSAYRHCLFKTAVTSLAV